MSPTPLILLSMLGGTAAVAHPEGRDMFPQITAFLTDRAAEFDRIPADRRADLDELAGYVRTRRDAGEPVRLTFICTHNSRRSHLAQLWAAVAAEHHGLSGVETFSGGTEATAFNPRAVAALRRAGFSIDVDESAADHDPGNPRYRVSSAESGSASVNFSKKYDAPPNPTADFCAVLVCSEADEACPLVKGADVRVSLPYVDPKAADGTPGEAAAYDERSRQIAREMLYAFSRVR